MCGRFACWEDVIRISKAFELEGPVPSFGPRYNLAPTQDTLVILDATPTQASVLRWGLVPPWAKDPSVVINARAETLNEKPSFKRLVQRRRCVVIANAFYEWKTTGTKKTPFMITTRDGVFCMAGLWDEWNTPNGNPLRTFTIITTSHNKTMATIHDRMPVIINTTDRDRWLRDADTSILQPYPGTLTTTPISTLVNNPKNDGPEIIATASQRPLI